MDNAYLQIFIVGCHLFVVSDQGGQLKVKLCDWLGGTCKLACPSHEKTKLYHPQKLYPPFSEPIHSTIVNYQLAETNSSIWHGFIYKQFWRYQFLLSSTTNSPPFVELIPVKPINTGTTISNDHLQAMTGPSHQKTKLYDKPEKIPLIPWTHHYHLRL